MPYFSNRVALEATLNAYDTKLANLFDLLEDKADINSDIKGVQEYFRTSFSRAVDKYSAQDIVASYQLFVDLLAKVRSGETSPETALSIIEETNESRAMSITFYNLANTLALIFWAVLAAVVFNFSVAVGMTLMLLQPCMAILLIVGCGALVTCSITSAISCFDDFKSYDRLDNEDQRERNLVSFFKPKPVASNEPSLENEVDEGVVSQAPH